MSTDNNAPADDVVARLRIGTPDNPKHEVVWVQNLRAHLSEGMFSRRFFPEWCDIFLENINALLQAATEAASEIERLRAERDEALRTALSDERAWPLMGYAPGNYSCKCVRCGQMFEGDKRAINCLECAAILMRANLQNAWTAIRMIREAVEEFGPVASLESEDANLSRGPEPVHAAEAIVEALSRIRALTGKGV